MKPISEDWGLAALEIDEAATKKNGVLMQLKGPSFFRDVPSRNKRSYVGETWPNALKRPEVKQMMENGLMFGTIGHLDADMDALVRDNKVAIRTSSLAFNKGTGIGEGKYEILDTELGRLVKTLYDTGSKFFVSTKAIGEYKGEDNEGNQKIDPDKFQLKRVDLVCDPGFLQAQPELREQLEEAYKHESDVNIILECQESLDKILQNKPKEEKRLDNKDLVEKIMGEKIALENALTVSNKDLEIAETKLAAMEGIKAENAALVERAEAAESEVKEHAEFFEEVGDKDQIRETLLKAKAFGEQVSELGGIEDVSEKLTELNKFLVLGDDADSMKEALESALSIHESLVELVDVEEGENPLDKIKEALVAAKDFIAETKAGQMTEDVAEVAAKFGVADEKIADLVEAKGKDGAIEILEGLSGKEKISVSSEISEDGDKGSSITESSSQTRADRLFKGSGHKKD